MYPRDIVIISCIRLNHRSIQSPISIHYPYIPSLRPHQSSNMSLKRITLWGHDSGPNAWKVATILEELNVSLTRIRSSSSGI